MRIFRILTLLALAAVIPMKAGAGPIVVGDVVNFSDLPGNTGGGEFKLTDISNAADWIITFCMQKTEYMNFTNNFIVGSINNYTLTDPDDKGGVNGQDPISSYTAWLYTQFTNGTLANYAYTTGNNVFASREASANALQHAFWGFEQEETLDQNNYFVQLAMNNTPSNFGIGDVRVLNMLQNSLFATMTQPVKGLANAIGAAVLGVVLAHLYVALVPLVSGTLASGPPAYDLEVWLANALLSVTFPFLIYYAVFFGYWPLTKPATSPVVAKT